MIRQFLPFQSQILLVQNRHRKHKFDLHGADGNQLGQKKAALKRILRLNLGKNKPKLHETFLHMQEYFPFLKQILKYYITLRILLNCHFETIVLATFFKKHTEVTLT